MRSIIFISALTLASPAMAAPDGPTLGCYMREYSQAHLDAHPDQVAKSLHMWVHDQTFEGNTDRFAYLVVQFANQGHVLRDGHGPQKLDQSLICFSNSDGPGCAVECDGGSFTVTKEDAKGITIATQTLWMGDTEGCGGAIDLAEFPGREVKYRLNKVDKAHCLAQIEN